MTLIPVDRHTGGMTNSPISSRSIGPRSLLDRLVIQQQRTMRTTAAPKAMNRMQGDTIMRPTIPIGFTAVAAISITALLGLLLVWTLMPPPDTEDQQLAAHIDHLLTTTFQASEPGAAVIVVRNGQVLLRKGYGLANLELGVPVAP